MSNQSSPNTHVRSTWKFLKFLLLVHYLNGFAFATSFIDPHPRVYKPVRSGRPAIGISIGNSWSSIGLKNSLSEPDEIGMIIPNKNGRQSIPSVVSFTESGRAMVGEEAVEILLTHPERSVTGFMRLLGKNFSEVKDFVDAAEYSILDLENDQLAIEIWAGEKRTLYSATEVTALMIKELKNMAEEYIGKEINETVMSIPASYGDREREAMENAAKIAGLEIGSPVSDSSLASLLYELDSSLYLKDDHLYLVYNFDGASFEANVLAVEDGVYEALSAVRFEPVRSKGYEEDWNHLRDLYQDQQSLRKEQNMESLFSASRADQKPLVVGAGSDDSIRKTETVVSFDINELFKVIDQAIHDANRTIYDFDGIVAFGETTRMPGFQSLIKNRFRFTVPIYDYIDPKAVLALGAATQAWYRRENVWNGACVFDDMCGSRLGVETAGGVMTRIIKRGTIIPTKKTQIFTTTLDNQTSVTVNMFAGERSFVAHNKKFGSLELRDLKTLPRGEPKIEIAFEMWYNHNLKVILTELGTNNTNSTTFQENQYHDFEFLEKQLEEKWDTREEQIHLEMVQQEINEGEIAHQGAEPNQIMVLYQPPPSEELQHGRIHRWWQWLRHPWVGDMYLW